jgi:ABC-type uncharacterized transport system auxiliary subunit
MSARRAVLLPVLLLLAGCFRLSQPAPQIREYRLDYAPPPATGSTLAVTLRVPPLGVAAVYDREPIVYREGTYSTGAYFSNRWSANPGQMVADLLARDLADSGLYRAVQRAPSVLASNYQLNGEIEEIEERLTTNSCTAHLRVRVVLLRTRGAAADPVRWRTAYTEDEPCACNDARALAGAMSRALERVSAQLQREVYNAIAADVAATRPAP